MLRNSLATDRDTWSRTCGLLILGFVCYALPWHVVAALPVPADNTPALQIQGSNTIGAKLGPALIKGLLVQEGFSDVRIEGNGQANEQQVLGRNARGQQVRIDVAAHGSSTGFV